MTDQKHGVSSGCIPPPPRDDDDTATIPVEGSAVKIECGSGEPVRSYTDRVFNAGTTESPNVHTERFVTIYANGVLETKRKTYSVFTPY